ncbi:unnamed protein product [Camellia sinensis]
MLKGPHGGSGVGFGNFLEIKPLDVDLKLRNSTWLTKADLLFVDSPVGMGFSYVEDESLAVKTDEAKFSWGPLLKDLSRLDSNALYSSNSLAQKIQQELAEEKYEDATNTWGVLRDVISAGSNDVDFYNFMYTMVPASLYLGFSASIIWVAEMEHMTLGTILMCFLQKKDAKGEEASPDSSVSFYSSIVSLSKSVIAPLFDLRMLLIIPLIAYSGLQQAFVWAEYTKYIAEPTLGESSVSGAMAMYGAFDAIFVTSGVLSILYPLLMAAALEIGDGIFNTQLNALLGMLFKHDMKKERTAQGLAVCFDRSCVFCEPLRFFACCVSGYACCSLHLCCRVSIPHSYGRESILLC